MNIMDLEVLLELGLVLLAPWIHQAYLWRKENSRPKACVQP